MRVEGNKNPSTAITIIMKSVICFMIVMLLMCLAVECEVSAFSCYRYVHLLDVVDRYCRLV